MIPTRLSVCALAAALLVGCATTRPPGEEPGPDPLETGNRGIFWFNMQFDRALLRPVAKGWGFVTPEYFRVHLDQMMRNIEFPRNFLNSLLQGEVRQSGVELARFGINTTVGIVGFFDPASKLDLHTRPEDLGQTLGVWGVPPGAYLQVPLLGPATVRDVVTLPERVFNTLWLVLIHPQAALAVGVTDTVNLRELNDETLEELRDASLDFYVAVRNAYLQRREMLVRNGEPEEEPTDDLYELDEDDE